jgi:hypothetical protein
MVLVQSAWAIRWAASKAAMPEKTPLLMSTGAAGAGAGVARVRALELGLGLELVVVLGGGLDCGVLIGGLAGGGGGQAWRGSEQGDRLRINRLGLGSA